MQNPSNQRQNDSKYPDGVGTHVGGVGNAQAIAVVVEDEWFLRMELADALAEAGWEVVELATGEQALDWLEAGGEAALLVTDIRLPGPAEGWDVAEKFHAAHPETQVIYCSANPLQEARQVPGSLFFAKPVRMDVVLEACGAPSPR
jgi:DNA-binding NtrC family response regulator